MQKERSITQTSVKHTPLSSGACQGILPTTGTAEVFILFPLFDQDQI